MSIKGGPPEWRVWIESYRATEAGKATGVVVVKRDGALVGTTRLTTFTDPEDVEEAVRHIIGLGYPKEADGALQEALVGAKQSYDAAGGYTAPVLSKFAPQAKWVVDQLGKDGSFLRSSGTYYYMNGLTHVPVEVPGWEMEVVLRAKFGLNSKEKVQSYVMTEIAYHTHLNGTDVELYQLAHYRPDKNLVYMDAGNGTVYRLDGKEVKAITNGDEGVLFRKAHPFQTAWKYVPNAPRRLKTDLVDRLSFAEGEEAPLAVAEQRLLFLVWILSFLFRSELPTRPIALAYGQAGSGKTTAFRRVGQILFGPNFQVNSLDKEREDRYWETVSNLPYVVYDNVDSRPPWLDDALAMTSTGTQVSKRKLYSDNRLLNFAVDTFLALTARTPKFRREDVADRLLIFFFQRVEGDKWIGEREMREWLVDHRDELMSELADRANKVLTASRVTPTGSAIRLVDFAAVAERIGASLGHKDQLLKILEKLRGAQIDFASEENPLTIVIEDWCAGFYDGVANHSRDVQASKLAGELTKVATQLGVKWRWTTGQMLGHAFSGQKTLLEGKFVVTKSTKGGEGNFYRVRPKSVPDQAKML